MNEFAILTNCRRAVIALIHSVVFLSIALGSLVSSNAAGPIWRAASIWQSLPILLIYFIVTAVLMYLARISRAQLETLYFTFCATSAGTGLLRAVFGDPARYVAPSVRIVMLACAVGTGIVIVRGFWGIPAAAVENEG